MALLKATQDTVPDGPFPLSKDSPCGEALSGPPATCHLRQVLHMPRPSNLHPGRHRPQTLGRPPQGASEPHVLQGATTLTPAHPQPWLFPEHTPHTPVMGACTVPETQAL